MDGLDLVKTQKPNLVLGHFWGLSEPSPINKGRKLNVLCTFNLRPVSTGFFSNKSFFHI